MMKKIYILLEEGWKINDSKILRSYHAMIHYIQIKIYLGHVHYFF